MASKQFLRPVGTLLGTGDVSGSFWEGRSVSTWQGDFCLL